MSYEVKLPEPVIWCRNTGSFSAIQLRAYGEACRKDEREKMQRSHRSAADNLDRFSRPSKS